MKVNLIEPLKQLAGYDVYKQKQLKDLRRTPKARLEPENYRNLIKGCKIFGNGTKKLVHVHFL